MVGALVGLLFPLSVHYEASAQVALVPGPALNAAEASSFWEVLSQGQVSRTAATVFRDPRWLPAAQAAAGVPADQLNVTVGAVPDTTLVSITANAPTAHAAQAGVRGLLDAATGEVGAVSAPFQVRVVSGPDTATSLTTSRTQVIAAAAFAGVLIGATAMFAVVWRRGQVPRAAGRRSDEISAAS
ncbi:hypothetical protein B5P44_11530 [Mycobacterium sp. CBMA 213]|nr:hypothetical protein [Mycolicibacterium sp. CBMA 213]